MSACEYPVQDCRWCKLLCTKRDQRSSVLFKDCRQCSRWSCRTTYLKCTEAWHRCNDCRQGAGLCGYDEHQFLWCPSCGGGGSVNRKKSVKDRGLCDFYPVIKKQSTGIFCVRTSWRDHWPDRLCGWTQSKSKNRKYWWTDFEDSFLWRSHEGWRTWSDSVRLSWGNRFDRGYWFSWWKSGLCDSDDASQCKGTGVSVCLSCRYGRRDVSG